MMIKPLKSSNAFYVSVSFLMMMSTSVHSMFELSTEEIAQSYQQGKKGAVNDSLFYAIGGGAVISQPPSGSNIQKIGLGVRWNSDLMCGNFDLQSTVKNQLNGATDGFKNMMSDVINSATGSVASLPAMIIQRANPGLYELLTNGVLQANVAFDKSQINCQNMAKKLGELTVSDRWTQAAVSEEYKEIVANTNDAVLADQQYQKARGREGVKWVGGQKRGGAGQPAIKPTYDLAKAGFNILNNQSVNSNASVNASECKGSLCKRYKTSDEAAKAVVTVLGDRSVRTCSVADECQDGAENESGLTTPGIGFSSMQQEVTQENLDILVKLVNGDSLPNNTTLSTLKSGDIMVTRGIVQALKEDPDNAALIQRLASELAMAETVSIALGMRHMLVIGQSEPNVADHSIALIEAERRLDFLDKELQTMKNEMELRKAISSNSLLTALTRQEERNDNHRLQQKSGEEDKGFSQLNNEVEGK